MRKTKLYSPAQIRTGVVLGGPIAAIYFLRKNFIALGKSAEANQTIIYGAIYTVVLTVVAFFIPRGLTILGSLVTMAIAGNIAERRQLKKAEITASEHHELQSNWRTFFQSVLFLVLELIAIFGALFLYGFLLKHKGA